MLTYSIPARSREPYLLDGLPARLWRRYGSRGDEPMMEIPSLLLADGGRADAELLAVGCFQGAAPEVEALPEEVRRGGRGVAPPPRWGGGGGGGGAAGAGPGGPGVARYGPGGAGGAGLGPLS